MSVERAARGSPHDRDTLAAALVDVLKRARKRGQFPCATVVSSALTVLCSPAVSGIGPISLSLDGLPLDKHRLLRDHPTVVRECVRFLSRASNIRSSESASESCTCELPDKSILEQLHESANSRVWVRVRYPQAESSVVVPVANRVLDAIMICLEPCTLQLLDKGLVHYFRRADYRQPAQNPPPWPEGRGETIKSFLMAKLGATYPSENLVIILNNMLDLLPFPLRLERATTVVIPQVVFPFLTKLALKWKQSVGDKAQAYECIKLFHNCGLLFRTVSFGPDAMVWVALRRHRQLYSQLMPTLADAFRAARDTAKKTGCSDEYTMLMAFVGRVYWLLGFDYSEKEFGIPVKETLSLVMRECIPLKRQLMAAEELLRANGSCARRGCSRDYLTLRRGLYACCGCYHVFYCSRSCQKKAWRDELSPHRSFCNKIRGIVYTGLAVPQHWKVAVHYQCDKDWDEALTFYERFCAQEKEEDIKEVLLHLYKCYAQDYP